MADEELGDLVMQVARTLRRRWRDVLGPWDLSPHQARALRVVAETDGLRLSALAEALRIAPRSATEVVDGLAGRGLVERVADDSDRRAVVVRVTEEGRRVRREVDAARAADSRQLFQQLPPADRDQLARTLRALAGDS